MSIAETSAAPDAEILAAGAARRFAFVPNLRPLLSGALIGSGVLGALFLGAWRSGRLGEIDGTFVAVLLGSVAFAVALVVGGGYRTARRTAATLGHVELDDRGLRWRWGDGSRGFDAPWAAIDRAAFDARNCVAVLYRREGGPLLVGVLSEHGVPAGTVVPERFGELAALVKARVPEAPAGGGAGAAPSALRLGLLCGAVAAILYGANLALGASLGWRRQLVTAPALLGLVGALITLAAARIRAGRGPVVSPLYSPGYRARVLRFLIVLSLGNFLLLWLLNGYGR